MPKLVILMIDRRKYVVKVKLTLLQSFPFPFQVLRIVKTFL